MTDAGIWKPAAGAYSWALEQLSVDAREAMLVAVHPWDIVGAFARAEVEATSMVELASLLAED